MELTSLLTIRTDDSHATPVSNLNKLYYSVKTGYSRTGKFVRVISH